jgi:hypothetical protein
VLLVRPPRLLPFAAGMMNDDGQRETNAAVWRRGDQVISLSLNAKDNPLAAKS